MIEVDAVTALVDGLSTLSLDEFGLEPVTVVRRMLDGTDPNFSIGVFLYNWTPMERPNIGGSEPAIGRYRFYIQTFLKASERQEGELWSITLAKKVRNLVYRDRDLRMALVLTETGVYTVERTIRFGIDQSEFMDSPITGGFAFFSQTNFWLETEVV